MNTTNFLEILLRHEDLSVEQATLLFDALANGSVHPAQKAAFLVALRMKGESIEEIVGFVQAMRNNMVKVCCKGSVIDTAGTGGDGMGTFNISTAAALVVAGAGVQVAKHGIGAMSSKCGSADVLRELGVHVSLTPQQAEEILARIGLVFLLAPLYHPATKHIVEVRRALGVRTVFNILGPFTNPASVKRQVIGVANKKVALKLANVATQLDYDHLVIVTGEDGMDEVSLSAPTRLFEVKQRKIKKMRIRPEDFDMKQVMQKAVLGGDSIVNAKIIREVLDGIRGPQRDIVTLNSAVALYVAGRVKSIVEGAGLAAESIDRGYAKQALKKLVEETQKYAKN